MNYYAKLYRWLLILSIVCLARQTSHYVFKVHNVAIDIDYRIAADAQNDIIAYIKNFINYDYPDHIAEQLQNTFSYIDSVTIDYSIPHSMHIEIQAKEPWCLLNQTQLLMPDGTLCPQGALNQYCQAHCQIIAIKSDTWQNDIQLICTWLRQLPAHIFESYRITWYDQTHIQLQEKLDMQFIILCSHDTVLQKTLVQQCHLVKECFTDQKSYIKQNATQFIADVRFENQIIMFAEKGGNYNGGIC